MFCGITHKLLFHLPFLFPWRWRRVWEAHVRSLWATLPLASFPFFIYFIVHKIIKNIYWWGVDGPSPVPVPALVHLVRKTLAARNSLCARGPTLAPRTSPRVRLSFKSFKTVRTRQVRGPAFPRTTWTGWKWGCVWGRRPFTNSGSHSVSGLSSPSGGCFSFGCVVSYYSWILLWVLA